MNKNSLYNQNLKKELLEEGEGDTFPSRFNEVEINFLLRYKDGEEIEVAQNPEEPYVFKIGDVAIIKGINLALTKMKKGEMSKFIIPPELGFEEGNIMGAQADKELEFIVKLVDFREVEINKFDLEKEERIIFAKEYKEKATNFYKEKKFNDAILIYEKAFNFVEWEKDETSQDLKQKLLLNLALLYTKIDKNEISIEKSTFAIDLFPDLAKAYFRRAQAHLNLSLFKHCIDDLKKALEMEPKNKDIIKLWKVAQDKKNEWQKKNKKMFEGALDNDNNNPKEIICEYSYDENFLIRATINYKEKNENKKCDFLIELFKIIHDEITCILFEICDKVESLEIESKPKNYIEFTLQGLEKLLEKIESKRPKKMINFEEKNLLYLSYKEDSPQTILGLTLAQLPWFNSKNLVLGKICTKDVPLDKISENQILSIKFSKFE